VVRPAAAAAATSQTFRQLASQGERPTRQRGNFLLSPNLYRAEEERVFPRFPGPWNPFPRKPNRRLLGWRTGWRGEAKKAREKD